MVLKLFSHHIEAIGQYGEDTYPDECCGLLLGKISKGIKTVVEVRATENVWNAEAAQLFSVGEGERENQLSNYAISPQTMLEVQKEVRDRNLQIIGIYHSHPNHSAMGSECDHLYAWERYSYIIVSVVQGQVEELRCWELDSEFNFQAEEIIIVNNLEKSKTK